LESRLRPEPAGSLGFQTFEDGSGSFSGSEPHSTYYARRGGTLAAYENRLHCGRSQRAKIGA
jgi:hypothetical protein